MTIQRGGQAVKERREFSITGGMCPRCEGRGAVTDFDLTALYDDTKSLDEGALTIPGYSMDGWYGRIYSGSGFFDPDKPIRTFTKKELDAFLHMEPTRIKVDGVNITFEGLIPKISKSMLAKDVEAMQPHIRAFVERAVTFTACPECEGTRLAAEARALAERLEIHYTPKHGSWLNIAEIERAESSASISSLYKIALALESRIQDLFGEY